jgi:ArsR family transcriptional regulator
MPALPPTDGSAMPVRADPLYVAKAQLFRVLGHPVRIRILELLRDGERTVGDLQIELSLDSSGTSQHLATLRYQGVLESRRDGINTYYRIRDPRVNQLLAVAKQILRERSLTRTPSSATSSPRRPSSPGNNQPPVSPPAAETRRGARWPRRYAVGVPRSKVRPLARIRF